jgi:hypothetical protein
MQEEAEGADYLAPKVELLGLSTMQRVCSFCEEHRATSDLRPS